MATSRQLAGLIGPTLLAVSLSEALNLDVWRSFAGHDLAPLVYLNGTLLFVAGLAVVRAHNRWTFGWPVLVTLVGWIVMLGGLFRMFAPASAQRPGQDSLPMYGVLAVIFVVGVVLTFNACRRENG